MLDHPFTQKPPRYYDEVAHNIRHTKWHEPMPEQSYTLELLKPKRWLIGAKIAVQCSTSPLQPDYYANYRRFQDVFSEKALERRAIHDSTLAVAMDRLRYSPDDVLDDVIDARNTVPATAIKGVTGGFYGEIRKLPNREHYDSVQIVFGDIVRSRFSAVIGSIMTGLVLVRTPDATQLEQIIRLDS